MSPDPVTLDPPATDRWKVLYFRRPPWLIGEVEADRDVRVRLSAFAPMAPDDAHYPGDPAGKVISVIPIEKSFSPGELIDPNRAVAELELSDEDLHAIRGRESRILAGRPAAVTFDAQHGAVASELKRLYPLDFLVREKEEEDARLAAEERNRLVDVAWEAEVDTWRESLAEAVALEAVFETPLPAWPVHEIQPEPEFALAASRLAKLLPPTVVHSGAGLYKVDGSGSTHNDTIVTAVKDNGTTTITLTTGIARDCTGEVFISNGNSYAIKSKTDDTHIVVVGDASGEAPGTGNDAYTKLLLHCDGADGATSFPDDSFSAPTHVVTAEGNAEVDTAQKVFGTGSALFGGVTTDYLSVPSHADWQFGAGDFTVDFRVRIGSVGASKGFFAQRQTDTNLYYLRWNVAGYLEFIAILGGVVKINFRSTAWTPIVDTQYHIALVRNGTAFYFFVDGVAKTGAGTPDADPIPVFAQPLWVGRSNTYSLDGWIDEFRLSKGIARWTSGFTPPTAAYTSSTGVCTISPYTTIQSAADQLGTDQGTATFTASQYIRIFAGTYDENVVVPAGLEPSFGDFGLIIEGDPDDDRDNIIIAPAAGDGPTWNGPHYVIIRHLKSAPVGGNVAILANSSSYSGTASDIHVVCVCPTGIYLYRGGVFEDCDVEQTNGNANANGFKTSVAGTIARCSCSNAFSPRRGTGIVMAHDVRIEDCVCTGYGSGIGRTDGRFAVSLQVANCTIYACDNGVLLGGVTYGGVGLHMVNTIISECTDCIYTYDYPEESATVFGPRIILRNNCFHNYTNFANDGATPKTYAQLVAMSRADASGDLDATDPLLTNPGAGDFSLQTTSPCWDTGHGSGVVTDYLGTVLDAAHPPIGAWSPGALVKTPPTMSVAVVGTTATVTLTGSAHRYRVRMSTAAGVEEEEKSRAGAGDVVFTGIASGYHLFTAWSVTADDVTALGEHSAIYRLAYVTTPPTVAVIVSGTTITVTLTGSADRYRVRIATAAGVEEDEVSRTGAGVVTFSSVAVGDHLITAWSVATDDTPYGEHSPVETATVVDTSVGIFERVANVIRGRFKSQVADAAPWGSVVTKTTVSAAAADNSFNDSVEDLSVFVPRQQVLVSGFANGANNGYFTVVSAAANKLVVKDGTLVDEAVGPTVTIMSALPTQYDNDGSFERPKGAPWCRFTVLQGETAQVTAGGSKRFRYPGVAIAQLFLPLGEGDKRGLELADAVKLAFRSLTASGVVFLSPSAQNMGRQEGEWQLNVSCPFFADDLV